MNCTQFTQEEQYQIYAVETPRHTQNELHIVSERSASTVVDRTTRLPVMWNCERHGPLPVTMLGESTACMTTRSPECRASSARSTKDSFAQSGKRGRTLHHQSNTAKCGATQLGASRDVAGQGLHNDGNLWHFPSSSVMTFLQTRPFMAAYC